MLLGFLELAHSKNISLFAAVVALCCFEATLVRFVIPFMVICNVLNLRTKFFNVFYCNSCHLGRVEIGPESLTTIVVLRLCMLNSQTPQESPKLIGELINPKTFFI